MIQLDYVSPVHHAASPRPPFWAAVLAAHKIGVGRKGQRVRQMARVILIPTVPP